MIDRLDRFMVRELAIGALIGDLEGLLYQLHLIDEEWRQDFVDAWSALEISYAVALDREQPIPGPEAEGFAESVRELRRLVHSQLDRLST